MYYFVGIKHLVPSKVLSKRNTRQNNELESYYKFLKNNAKIDCNGLSLNQATSQEFENNTQLSLIRTCSNTKQHLSLQRIHCITFTALPIAFFNLLESNTLFMVPLVALIFGASHHIVNELRHIAVTC